MPKCTIDGREVEFSPGTNLIEVAKSVGIEIPFFCYHPGLSVVAQCRMCTVEVEKMPKLQTACSTVATEGMVVKTRSQRVRENQASVMEFLLINHPLDCPICDKSGECDLQDNSYKYGDAYMRTTEERRTYLDLDMGPVIKKNMNRCIHCTRCIRFGDEVAGIREMVAVARGNNTEITTIDGRPLETDYAGNYADICPTGSLTLKDFRFKKRVWYLKKTDSVCEGCSRGCNIQIHEDGNVIYRLLPRTNMEVNRYWMCDEGRFGFHYINHSDRVLEPMTRSGGELVPASWAEAISKIRQNLTGKKALVLVGADLTNEEAHAIQQFVSKELPSAIVYSFSDESIRTSKQDGAEDQLLRMKSKVANLRGLEALGYSPCPESLPRADVALVFRGGRAVLPNFSGMEVFGIGVFTKEEASSFSGVLPGTSFAEKSGTFTNSQNMKQSIKRALRPLGQSKQTGEILMTWMNLGSKSGAA